MVDYGSTERSVVEPDAPPAGRARNPTCWLAAALLAAGVIVAVAAGSSSSDDSGSPATSFAASASLSPNAVADMTDDSPGQSNVPSKPEERSPRKKRGSCSWNPIAGDLETLSGIAWHYSWALEESLVYENDTSQVEFVPMVWGINNISDQTLCEEGGGRCIDSLKDFVPKPTSTAMLGFNEPNFQGQSNMTAEEACSQWPTVVDFAHKHGLRLGSPAAAYCEESDAANSCNTMMFEWFDTFFHHCSLDTVDFVTTHRYGCNYTLAFDLVLELNARYNKPVWLTEFSCSEAGPQAQLDYQKWILPKFDALPSSILERYSWFATRTLNSSTEENAALMHATKPRTLTMLGKYYNGDSDTYGTNATNNTNTAPRERTDLRTDANDTNVSPPTTNSVPW